MEKIAISIKEFCKLVGISRGSYYNLKRTGQGPRTMKILRRELISREAVLS